MRHVKQVVSALLFAVVSIVSMLVSPGNALAASVNDNVITTVDALVIPSPPSGTSCKTDFSLTWSSDFRATLSGAALTSFDNRVAWGASLVNGGEGPASSAIHVYWWEAANLPATPVFENGYRLTAQPTGNGGFSINWIDCTINGGTFPLTKIGIASAQPNTEDDAGWTRPFILFGVNDFYSEDYAGVRIPSEYTPPAPKYVAMGDSFSSGEGNPSFETGTDSPANECHRSSMAYPRLLQNNLSLDLGTAKFVACSGATTNNVLYGGSSTGAWSESPQVSFLSEETELVTITVGGNDVGFKDYATACTLYNCGFGYPAHTAVMSAINGNLSSNLEEVYRKVLEESGDAKLYVLGYPYLTGDVGNGDCLSLSTKDRDVMDVTDALNAKISASVTAVRYDSSHPTYEGRIEYVPVNSSNNSSPFDGKILCNDPSYFNNVNVFDPEYSYHPNALGQGAYKTIMEAYLD